MQVNYSCGAIILLAYIAFGLVGIRLEFLLHTHIQGIPNPVTLDAIQTERGRRLFRLDSLWRKCRIPVWIGLIVIGAVLCRK